MISQTSEYALRAVVYLARIGGGPAVTGDIARATKVPPGYLARVLRTLSRVGILSAQRGSGGGFALAKPAGKISVWDVLEATDSGIGRIKECPLGLEGHDISLCSLHSLLDGAIAHVESVFLETSIQDILMAPGKTHPLCDTPDSASLTINRKKT